MGSTSNSGHYQAYVSNHQHSWINFDDDYVTEISVKNNVDLFNNFKYLFGYLVRMIHRIYCSMNSLRRRTRCDISEFHLIFNQYSLYLSLLYGLKHNQ